MNYSDEEVELISEWHGLRKAYTAAKENRDTDPEAYAEAKEAMTTFRAQWREIRQAFAPDRPADTDDDGTAAPVTLSAAATPQEIAEATKES